MSPPDFPLENLPYGVFSRKFHDPCKLRWKKGDKMRFDGEGEKSIGVRIGGETGPLFALGKELTTHVDRLCARPAAAGGAGRV